MPEAINLMALYKWTMIFLNPSDSNLLLVKNDAGRAVGFFFGYSST
jgi:hypothetical protein